MIDPDSDVPANVGWSTFVMPSVFDTPVSLDGSSPPVTTIGTSATAAVPSA